MDAESDAVRFVAAVFRAVGGHIGAGRTVRVGEAMRAAGVPPERAQAALDLAFANYWVDTLARLVFINNPTLPPIDTSGWRDMDVWLTAMGEDIAGTTHGDPRG